MEGSVSVIIPVFNAELYIEKAILSAVIQPEVEQIVVVNDGSSDNTQKVLDKLVLEHSILEVYHHPNRQNKGRSTSRNLAISKAKYNYIAFLDADDFYLENRFVKDFKILKNDKSVEGVYNAIGVHFYRDYTQSEFDKLKLTTLTKKINPDQLFEHLIYYKSGHFSLDGLILKKEVFKKVGLFNENLTVAEDSDLILKLAMVCQLKPGILDKAVTMRGVHDDNVFDKSDVYEDFNLKVFESLLSWTNANNINLKYVDWILDNLWRLKYSKQSSLANNTSYWSSLFFKNPKILFSKLSIKYCPLVRQRKKYFSFFYKK